MRRPFDIALLLVALLTCSVQSRAADLIIGQVAPLANPNSVGNQMRAGIELYFDAVNRAGGVGGNRLRLVTKDRPVAGDSVASKTRELLREAKPVALIGLPGTGPMEALIKDGVVAEAATPIIGIRTGATSLHTPMNPWLFHTRASYGVEMRKIDDHLALIGFKRVALFYENTAFGLEGRSNAQTSLSGRGLTPVATGKYEKDRPDDVSDATRTIAAAQPDAVIAVGETAAVAAFHKALRSAGNRPQVVTLSTVDAAGVVKLIGVDAAYGLGIAQVIPDPFHQKTAIAREFQDNARKLRPTTFELTQAGLEGYIAAKVLVEALKRAGAQPSPAQLRATLETLGRLDLGGISIEFTPTQRSGSGYVNIGIIGPQGRLLQ